MVNLALANLCRANLDQQSWKTLEYLIWSCLGQIIIWKERIWIDTFDIFQLCQPGSRRFSQVGHHCSLWVSFRSSPSTSPALGRYHHHHKFLVVTITVTSFLSSPTPSPVLGRQQTTRITNKDIKYENLKPGLPWQRKQQSVILLSASLEWRLAAQLSRWGFYIFNTWLVMVSLTRGRFFQFLHF